MTNFLANISVSALSTRNNITGYFVFPFLKEIQKVMLFDQNLKFDSVLIHFPSNVLRKTFPARKRNVTSFEGVMVNAFRASCPKKFSMCRKRLYPVGNSNNGHPCMADVNCNCNYETVVVDRSLHGDVYYIFCTSVTIANFFIGWNRP